MNAYAYYIQNILDKEQSRRIKVKEKEDILAEIKLVGDERTQKTKLGNITQ